MKQLFQAMLVGLIALQGLACAGAADLDAEAAAEDVELSAEDIAEEDGAGDELDVPESVSLLSPSERDEQLRALTRSALAETDAPDVAPLDNVVFGTPSPVVSSGPALLPLGAEGPSPSHPWDGKSRK